MATSPKKNAAEDLPLNDEAKRAMLEVLSDERKTWTWYTLDFALSGRGVAERFNVAALASALAAEGFITESPGDRPGMPIYAITSAGRAYLAAHEASR